MSKDEKFEDIVLSVKNCKKCNLFKTRNKPVVGDGSLETKILFIGEAPGYNEDLQGKPFVGKAGKVLDKMLESIDLARGDVYIANILKCRPPNNRNPLKSEIESCREYLDRQIDMIKPRVIVPLGNYAASFIFEKYGLEPEKISKIHGKVFEIDDISIMPFYHPAVATYDPNKLSLLINDFRTIKNIIKN